MRGPPFIRRGVKSRLPRLFLGKSTAPRTFFVFPPFIKKYVFFRPGGGFFPNAPFFPGKTPGVLTRWENAFGGLPLGPGTPQNAPMGETPLENFFRKFNLPRYLGPKKGGLKIGGPPLGPKFRFGSSNPWGFCPIFKGVFFLQTFYLPGPPGAFQNKNWNPSWPENMVFLSRAFLPNNPFDPNQISQAQKEGPLFWKVKPFFPPPSFKIFHPFRAFLKLNPTPFKVKGKVNLGPSYPLLGHFWPS